MRLLPAKKEDVYELLIALVLLGVSLLFFLKKGKADSGGVPGQIARLQATVNTIKNSLDPTIVGETTLTTGMLDSGGDWIGCNVVCRFNFSEAPNAIRANGRIQESLDGLVGSQKFVIDARCSQSLLPTERGQSRAGRSSEVQPFGRVRRWDLGSTVDLPHSGPFPSQTGEPMSVAAQNRSWYA
jgi:hypothetical protein